MSRHEERQTAHTLPGPGRADKQQPRQAAEASRDAGYTPDDPALHALAVAAGVRPTYLDGTDQWRTAPDGALREVLGALGLPADDPKTARESLARLRRARVRPGVTDVVIAWDGDAAPIRVRVPPEESANPIGLRILFEDGGERQWEHVPRPQTAMHVHAEGARSVAYDIALPGSLPYGYHSLEVRVGEDVHRAHLISAPRECPTTEAPEWGVFVPTYALHRENGFGVGDLNDLAKVASWTRRHGGTIVATLPLLDQFLAGPIHDPSPYAPVSRRFWNGLFVDPSLEPEYDHAAVRAVREDPDHQALLDQARRSHGVDHAAAWTVKTRLFAAMASALEEQESPRRRAFRTYVRQHPDLWRYARFRAATERHGPWREWPHDAAEGDLSVLDVDEDLVLMHAYIQWVADRQVARVVGLADDPAGDANGPDGSGDGMRLHLDLPLGAHASGYDVWNDRQAYADRIETGAPPDGFFEKGQKWGFAPLNPRRLRQSGYRHFAACLRRHLAHATLLRIDHVMGLHRLFWVPTGREATDGVYVHYPFEEIYAVVLLEAHRAGALIVGEDLGTVPSVVHEAMDRHRLHRTYVLQLQARSAGEGPPVPTENMLATLNTHDMVPFAAWWRGDDIEQRIHRGFIGEDGASDARARRDVTKARVLRGLTSHGEPRDATVEDAERWAASAGPGPDAGRAGDTGVTDDTDHTGGISDPGDTGDTRDTRVSRDADDAALPEPLPAGADALGPDLPKDLAEGRDRSLRFLFRGPAPLVVLNLEDLWFETAPQNQPGFAPDTPEGRENWARRTRPTLERLLADPEISATLTVLDRLRPRQKRGART